MKHLFLTIVHKHTIDSAKIISLQLLTNR